MSVKQLHISFSSEKNDSRLIINTACYFGSWNIIIIFIISIFFFHKSNQLISHFGQLHGEELNPQIEGFRDCIAPSYFKGDKYEQ